MGGKEGCFLVSGEGTGSKVREAEGGGDAAGIIAFGACGGGAFEKDVGFNFEIGRDNDRARAIVVGDRIGLQGDLVSRDATAILNEAFGVDFDDGCLDGSASGHSCRNTGGNVSGSSLEVIAGDPFGTGRDEGDFAVGGVDGRVDGSLVAEEGDVSGGGLEVAIDDHLPGPGRSLEVRSVDGGQGAEGDLGGDDTTAGFDSDSFEIDEGEGAVGRDGAIDGALKEA